MGTLFETYLKIIGYDISRASKKLEMIQALSPEEFHKWQLNMKWKIAKHHYDNNTFYQKIVGIFCDHDVMLQSIG